MVTCPRCQQPVDETVRSTCPLCFTPIPQATQPAGPLAGPGLEAHAPPAGTSPYSQPPSGGAGGYPPSGMPLPNPVPGVIPGPVPAPQSPRPMLNSGARISLTGEIIEAGSSAGPPPSYVGGPPPGSPRAAQPGAPSRAAAPVRRAPEAAPERTSTGNVAGIVIALIVVLGGAVGGWYWWMHRTNPRDQALAVYKAALTGDYKSAYTLCALGPAAKNYPNADAFAADQHKSEDAMLNSSPLLSPIKDTIKEAMKTAATTATVGDAAVSGDTADVPTSCKASFLGQSLQFRGTAHMVNESGIWKLDMTKDAGQKSSKAVADMIGKP